MDNRANTLRLDDAPDEERDTSDRCNDGLECEQVTAIDEKACFS